MAQRRSGTVVGRIRTRWGWPSAAVGAALAGALLLTGLTTGATAAARPSLGLTRVLEGYDRPVAVVSPPGVRNRLYIVEQAGRIQTAHRSDGTWHKDGVFLDLTDLVNDRTVPGNEDRGLLGLAFPPDHARTGRFYVSYTQRDPSDPGGDGDSAIAEYRRTDATHADPGSGRLVLVVAHPTKHHNAGDITFGPDGLLYLALGDGGVPGDPDHLSQDPGSLMGKVIRIDPLDPDGTGPRTYRVPATNPYIGRSGWRPEIWARGLRNPWRITFDARTGDMWLGDPGEDHQEEVDVGRATRGRGAGRGANWGWSLCEGTRAYPDGGPCDHAAKHLRAPVFVSRRTGTRAWDGGCAVIGGRVYRGSVRAWRGVYVFGDFCTRKLIVLSQTGRVLLVQPTERSMIAFGNDAAGRLYLADIDGSIWALAPRGDPLP